MKKTLLASAALLALCASANAADMRAPVYTKAPPVAAPVPLYNWTGIYIGAHIGGAFRGDTGLVGGSDGRFMGGGQVGADYQFAPSWVMGLEANYSATVNSDNAAFGNRNLGSVTGRLGYTWGPALLYAKGGYAWADTRRTFGFANGGSDGYTVGAGLEYMFAPNWSAKLEYQYYDLGRVNFIAPVAQFRNDEHTVKLGVNYRFNLGAPAAY